MAALKGLSGAHAILLASHLCASGQVSALPTLHAQFPNYLPLERVLRLLLTFLPESTEPQAYTSILQDLVDGTGVFADRDIDVSLVKDLPETVAKKRVGKLRLLHLKHHDDDDSNTTDLLMQFLIHRAHKIDTETSLQPFILDLLLPFYQRSPILRTWLISSLLPLLRLNYEYYPNQEGIFSLDLIESLNDDGAINVLLSVTGPQPDKMDLVRNLRGLIGPWIYGNNRSKRRRLNDTTRRDSASHHQEQSQAQRTGAPWRSVNEWLLSRSLVDFDSVVGAFTNWDGPQDVDLGGYDEEDWQKYDEELANLRMRHGQCGFAVVYANSDSSKRTLDGSVQIVSRIAELLNLENSFVAPNGMLPPVTFDTAAISSTSRASLLQNALLGPSNRLTRPSASSVSFLSTILVSLQILNELGHPTTCRAAANMCLHNNEDMQLLDLRSVIASTTRNTKSRDWGRIREKLLWLRHWQSESTAHHGLFWRIPQDGVETEILKALLEVGEYDLAVSIYTEPGAPLRPSQVEAAVKEAIFTAYDNASNGNRTRGGMKRAYDILQTFQPHFPDSASLQQIHALVLATHSLSSYSLTLQHGVPFQPVCIRIHDDPIFLIEKVLDQNPKGYTRLEDLLSIGRNLVAAGFPAMLPDNDASHEHTSAPEDDAVVTVERRITSLAISSALISDDFGTAYSYIFTRLAPPTILPTISSSNQPTSEDDISWRAVYNAGRHRTTSPNIYTQITLLTQRMELLSLALILAPTPDPLPEILGAWRRCDEELTILHVQETQEEEAWDIRVDDLSMVPGGFGPSDTEQDAFETKQRHARRARAQHSSSTQDEEAPMGLFEVARGAATALHKNAFPLRGSASGASAHGRHGLHDDGHEEDEHDESEEGRTRKRDVVSNMVTGGLASGIGWVLGAQPVNR